MPEVIIIIYIVVFVITIQILSRTHVNYLKLQSSYQNQLIQLPLFNNN